jgi:hypothetical protein
MTLRHHTGYVQPALHARDPGTPGSRYTRDTGRPGCGHQVRVCPGPSSRVCKLIPGHAGSGYTRVPGLPDIPVSGSGCVRVPGLAFKGFGDIRDPKPNPLFRLAHEPPLDPETLHRPDRLETCLGFGLVLGSAFLHVSTSATPTSLVFANPFKCSSCAVCSLKHPLRSSTR